MMMSRCLLVLGIAFAVASEGCAVSGDGSPQAPGETAAAATSTVAGEQIARTKPEVSAPGSTALTIPSELVDLALKTAASGMQVMPNNQCIEISDWECCDCFQQCKFIQLCDCDTGVCGKAQVFTRSSSSCRPPC